MKNVLLQKAVKLNKDRKMRKGWQTVVRTLAAGVVFCTTYVLILPAITMEEAPVCGFEAHVHGDACYAQPQAELNGCGLAADAVIVHQHSDLCRNAGGELICTLEERSVHTHEDSCYTQEAVLSCIATHVHSEACAKTEQTLICEIPESDEHIHGEGCFTVTEIPCTEPTAEDHVHEDACWQQTDKLSCGREELQLHTHEEACYDAEGNLTCTQSMVVEHVHTEACLVVPENAEPQLKCTLQVHTHTEDCYPLEEEAQLGAEFRCGFAAHSHTDACYDAENNLVCTVPDHAHEAACAVEDLDLSADVEDTEQWEAAFGKAAQAETRQKALLELAKAQLNYRESEKNVILEDGQLKGYTRYGDRFGMPYADWNTLFASFCVSYAGADESFPVETDALKWYLALEEQELLQKGIPQPGDLLFFGLDRRSEPEGELTITAVAVLEERYEEQETFDDLLVSLLDSGEEEKTPEYLLKTIQGDVNGKVDYVTVKESLGSLLGYAVLPEPVEEAPVLKCTLAEHIHGEACYDAEGNLICTETEHTHSEDCYAAEETEEEKKLKCTLAEHTHSEACYDAENNLICTETEHTHSDDCYAAEETRKLICTLAEHAHIEACFDAEGNLTCTETEHTHTDSCYEAEKTEEAPKEEIEDVLYQICTLPEHIHADSCRNPETGDMICGLSEHTHKEACYAKAEDIPMMETPLVCAVAEHIHETACFGADGSQTCAEPEHTHSWFCYAPAEATFPYEDDRVTMEVRVVSAKGLPKGLTMEVENLSEEDKAPYTDFALENAGGQLLDVTGYRIRFFYGGNEIQLPDAEVTANMTLRPVSGAEPMQTEEVGLFAAAFSRMTRMMAAPAAEDQPEDPQTEEQPVVVSVLQQNDTEVSRTGTATFDGENSEGSQMSVRLGSSRTVALASETAPTFRLEFYANMPHYVTDEDGNLSGYPASLDIIDTRNKGDGTGGSLPSVGNANDPNTKNGVLHLYLEAYANQDKEGNRVTTYKPATEYKFTEVYTADTKTYIPGMSVNYLNKLKNNPRYAIEQVWVSQDGGKTFKTYGLSLDDGADVDVEINDLNAITFTNNPANASDKDGVLLISSDTVIRFEYHVIQDSYTNAANFYDYDISTGKVYTAQTGGSTYNSISQAGSGKTYYMQTNQKGINTNANYSGSGAKLAFGNSNTGMGLEGQKLGNMYLNQYNRANYSIAAFKGCAFGIVSGYDYDTKTLQYASGIQHQNLFNEPGSVTGKTTYGGQMLNFERVGDTYTLVGVNGGRASGKVGEYRLGEFFNPGGYTNIFTNNFWPMDNLIKDNTTGHDFKFGESSAYDAKTKRFTNRSTSSLVTGTLPESDDGLIHNSYFGMQYAINFTMDGQYCGPLEYLFYGDDDMWVFLTDHKTGNSRLICDIGGVHSSVGSYTDLWDYIKKGEDGAGDYTLTFFYLERGASGSSCYMAFTLPAVTSVTQEVPEFGSLQVRKESPGEANPDATYEFRLDLTGTGAGDLYSYLVTGGEDRIGSITSGNTFTMKAGETVDILNLPAGISYTLTELFASDGEQTYDVSWTKTNGSTVSGTILSHQSMQGSTTETITCTNTALGALEIEKKVIAAETADKFNIEIALADKSGSPVSGTFGETVFTEGKATVALGHGEKVSLTGIPAGTLWTVTEADPENYGVTYQVNGEAVEEATGTIVHKTTALVTVENTAYYSLPNTGSVGTYPLTFGGTAMIAICLVYICITGRKRQKGGR